MSSHLVKNRRHKWTMDFSSRTNLSRQVCPMNDLPAPVGYSGKFSPDTAVQERDSSLVAKKCWDIALAPLKQLPMNLFLMYMAGNSISIFPIMMVGMMLWRPVQALMSLKTTFKMLEGSPQAYVQMLVFTVSNLLGIALATYKCSSMGLLPIYASDWLSFLDPQQRVEYSGGGISL